MKKGTNEFKKIRDSNLYQDYLKGITIIRLQDKYKLSEVQIRAILKIFDPDYVKHPESRNRWDNKEVLFLVDNYKKMSQQDIANHLNKSLKSVKNKAVNLGLIKNDKDYKIEFINKLLDMGFTAKSIANNLGITLNRVNQIRKELKGVK